MERLDSPPAASDVDSFGSTPAPSQGPSADDYAQMLQYAVIRPSPSTTSGSDLRRTVLSAKPKERKLVSIQVTRDDESERGASTVSNAGSYVSDRDEQDMTSQFHMASQQQRRPVHAAYSDDGSEPEYQAAASTAQNDISSPRRVRIATEEHVHAQPREYHTHEAAPEADTSFLDSGFDSNAASLTRTMESLCMTMKTEILTRYNEAKEDMRHRMMQQLQRQQEQHDALVASLRQEIGELREMMRSYEQNLDRKDQVINNLTTAISNEKGKVQMQKQFVHWRAELEHKKREHFTNCMAEKFCRLREMRKAFRGWRLVIENRWRQRIERSCQARAEETCHILTEEYEEKLRALAEQLDSASSEIFKLREERQSYEENIKKAFMRGVCALNMETMGMFGSDAQIEMSEQDAAAIAQERLTRSQLQTTETQHLEREREQHAAAASWHGGSRSAAPTRYTVTEASKRSVYHEPTNSSHVRTRHDSAASSDLREHASASQRDAATSSVTTERRTVIRPTRPAVVQHRVANHGSIRGAKTGGRTRETSGTKVVVERHTGSSRFR